MRENFDKANNYICTFYKYYALLKKLFQSLKNVEVNISTETHLCMDVCISPQKYNILL